MCTTMAIKTFSIPYWTNDLRTWTLLYRAIANGYETAFMCDARAENTLKNYSAMHYCPPQWSIFVTYYSKTHYFRHENEQNS